MISLKLASNTPNCHIANGHFEEYFKKTGRTLYYADCSAVEAAHSLLRQLEEAHGTKTVYAHGSANHLRRFKRSIVFFSSKNFWPDRAEDLDTTTEEEVDEMNNVVEEEDEMIDIEESIVVSDFFVPIPDNVKRELEQLRASNTAKDSELLAKDRELIAKDTELIAKDREILALKVRLAKYEGLDSNNN